jgi:threonine aldolase
MKMKAGLERKGYSFYIDSPTNQQFIIIGNERMQELKEKVLFSVWGPYDAGSSIIRLATSWATLEEDVDALIDLM